MILININLLTHPIYATLPSLSFPSTCTFFYPPLCITENTYDLRPLTIYNIEFMYAIISSSLFKMIILFFINIKMACAPVIYKCYDKGAFYKFECEL